MCGSRANYNLRFALLQRARSYRRIHQLSFTISVLQLPHLGILIRYDKHVPCPFRAAGMCRFGVCVCVRICCRAPLLPLANIRPSGGVPSALEASCTPQHQQLTTHLSAFMKVSSNSWAGCTPALLPCNLGSPHAELGVGGCSWTKTS